MSTRMPSSEASSDTRVQIEPVAGTDVFGELPLRTAKGEFGAQEHGRSLHLFDRLLGQRGSPRRGDGQKRENEPGGGMDERWFAWTDSYGWF